MKHTTASLQPTQTDRLRFLIGLLILVLAVIVLLVVLLRTYGVGVGKTATVQITAQGFQPATLKVKPGTKVVWTNTDTSLHQIASNPYPGNTSLPSLSSPGLESGQSYSYT